MSALAKFSSVAIVLLLTAAEGQAQSEIRLTPSDVANKTKGGAGAGTSGVAGIQTTILAGDPTKSGPYTIEIRVPAHTKIAAHSHKDERSAVVVSGMWSFGYGSKADQSLTKALPPGSFYTEPAGKPHFAMTGDQSAVVYITGLGPTSTEYVDSIAKRRP